VPCPILAAIIQARSKVVAALDKACQWERWSLASGKWQVGWAAGLLFLCCCLGARWGAPKCPGRGFGKPIAALQQQQPGRGTSGKPRCVGPHGAVWAGPHGASYPKQIVSPFELIAGIVAQKRSASFFFNGPKLAFLCPFPRGPAHEAKRHHHPQLAQRCISAACAAFRACHQLRLPVAGCSCSCAFMQACT
jgi:hypothetical protein